MNTEQFNGHTPGPWEAEHVAGGITIIWGADDDELYTLKSDEAAEVLDVDARLIAAAPDLLDLLKDARRMVQELHALLNGADGDEAYEWALRNIGEQEMTWWRTYYVRRS